MTDETVTESPSRPEAEAQAEYSQSSSTINTVKATASDAAEAANRSARNVAQSVSGAAASAARMVGSGQNPFSSGARSNDQYSSSSDVPQKNKALYVGNLFFEVSEKALQQEFSRFGKVVSTRIVYDARGLSKGYGRHINITTASEASLLTVTCLDLATSSSSQWKTPLMPSKT